MAVRVALAAIELDTSIQCRAAIDTAVVSEYSERMAAGDTFPPIEVYGTWTKCWIGDGWHRVLASRERALSSIAANLHSGGRADALKHALGANRLHGLHRSNADKRRCVEIALREFPTLSNHAIAEICGVDDKTVGVCRQSSCGNSAAESITGRDGKSYRARHTAAAPSEPSSTRSSAPRDPSQTGPAVADIPDKEESELVSSHLADLKRHWKSASSADRRVFLQWINRRKR
jgi:hypothetical protein